MSSSPAVSSRSVLSDTVPAFSSRNFVIVRLANNKAMMNMSLSLRPMDKSIRGKQEKLFINCTQIVPHGSNIVAWHALDGPTFRVIAQAIIADQWITAISQHRWGKDPTCRVYAANTPHTKNYQWVDYKGGPDRKQNNAIISRILKLTYTDQTDHQYPWALEIQEGPGRATPTGAVLPVAGATPTARVQMNLSWMQIVQWMQLGQEALAAVTHYDMAQWLQTGSS